MPVITITRGSLSATTKLTSRLAAELQCQAISREDIIEYGKKYGIDEFMQAARKIMEIKPPNSWDPHAAQIQHFLTIAKAALMDFVVKGNIIYHGLQTHFLLADVPRVFKLKVVAPLDYRIKTLMEESDISEQKARDHINFVDEMRISWAKFLYGENFDDPIYYDMILNMSNLNLDAMVHLIAQVVIRPEFRLDGGTVKKIRDVHLRALAKALLVRNADTRDMDFFIDTDSALGKVIVKRRENSPVIPGWKGRVEKALSDWELLKILEVIE